MIKDTLKDKKIAECVGLWLAEGDNKTNSEITFTNNCWDLIEFFHNNLVDLCKKHNSKIRIYVYNSTKKKVKVPLKNIQINYYIDKRATRPYYIWRVASVDLVKKWKIIVEKSKNDKELYAELLRGFFAGEGSIKESSHGSRVLRISQKQRVKFVEEIFNKLNIKHKFIVYKRIGYEIYGRKNWDKLAKIRIADLHPIRKEKFWKAYNGYKQYHYKRGYLKKEIYNNLNKYYTSKELSKIFRKSQDRIGDILILLKKECKIINFRIRNKDYWTNQKDVILISKIKEKYLRILEDNILRTKDISNNLNRCPKCCFNRLKELERLGLVKRYRNKRWVLNPTNKKIIII